MSKTSKIVVSLVVAAVVIVSIAAFRGGGSPPAPAAATQSDGVGGQRAGIQAFDDGITLGKSPAVEQNWFGGTIEPGSNVSKFTNYGPKMKVDFGEMYYDSGTASSTFRFTLFASSSPSISGLHLATAIAATSSSLINGVLIATSTQATTTNSVIAAVGGKGNGEVDLDTGASLYALIQAVDSQACGKAGGCEVATSTNRGISSIYWRARYHRTVPH